MTYKFTIKNTWFTMKNVSGKIKADNITSSFQLSNITITVKESIADGFLNSPASVRVFIRMVCDNP